MVRATILPEFAIAPISQILIFFFHLCKFMHSGANMQFAIRECSFFMHFLPKSRSVDLKTV